MTNSQYIWRLACQLENELGGNALKIERWLIDYLEIDGRKKAQTELIDEIVGNLDWDFISSVKNVEGVDYLYFYDEEMGACE